MNKEYIFSVIKSNLEEILSDLNLQQIKPEQSMEELGANSMDRAEIIIVSMAKLNIKVPLTQFGKAKNIQDVVDVFYNAVTTNKQIA